jgi:hypothetical protein
VGNISEHDSEEVREHDDCEKTWVHFSISGDSISVNNLLEWLGKCVGLEIGWRSHVIRNGVNNHDFRLLNLWLSSL